jgi:hypothetical protein
MRKVHGSINLHSIGNGSPDLDNSISLYTSLGDAGSTGLYLRHVTNGTRGFVHPVALAQMNTVSTRGVEERATSFQWSSDVAGIKLSYDHPCINEVVPDTVQNGDDFLDSIVDFERYAAAFPSDRWSVEFDDQNSGQLIMYGTLTAERYGFGNNYEEPLRNPVGFCH